MLLQNRVNIYYKNVKIPQVGPSSCQVMTKKKYKFYEGNYK